MIGFEEMENKRKWDFINQLIANRRFHGWTTIFVAVDRTVKPEYEANFSTELKKETPIINLFPDAEEII
jgi:hypothetical protein